MSGHEWDASLETGDALVDQQHRNIHELVAYLERADTEPDVLMRVLERLMEHVDCHFTTEEALMERTGFVGQRAEDHVREHRVLTARARDFVLQFRSGGLSEIEPVAAFLRGWLGQHVHECDRMLIEYVRLRGEVATLPERWKSRPPQMNGWAS